MTRLELATVCTDEFVPGALVSLFSFGENVPGFFELPLTVYWAPDFAPLSERHQGAIRSIVPAVRFEAVEQPRYSEATCPVAAHRAAFLTLEVFRMQRPDRVLFFDTDTLCVADCSDVFDCAHDFVACRAESEFSSGSGAQPWRAINSGFFALGRRWMNEAVYDGLLGRIAHRHDDAFADQSVINDYFTAESVYLLPDVYNFRHWGGTNRRQQPLGSDALFRELRPSIKVIHYSGYLSREKPWSPAADQGMGAYAEWHRWAERCARAHPSIASLLPKNGIG